MSGVASAHGERLRVFTQCSKCETVFRLSAQSLRAAGGQVRCGRCGEVFNALARLAEDWREFTRGESSLDQESRADEILQSAEAVAPAVAARMEVATESSAIIARPHLEPTQESLEVISAAKTMDLPAEEPEYEPAVRLAAEAPAQLAVEAPEQLPGEPPAGLVGELPREAASELAVAAPRDLPSKAPAAHASEAAQEPAGMLAEEAVTDAMLEFTLPPTELDRIFIETTPSVVQLLASERHRPEPGPVARTEQTTEFSLDALPESRFGQPASSPRADEHSADKLATPPAPSPEAFREARARGASLAETSLREGSPRDWATPEPHAARPASPTRAQAPARRTRNPEAVEAQMPEIGALRRRLSYPAWASAAIVFTLLLGAQVLVNHTDWISTRLSASRTAAATRPKLSVYQLQQWGVTGDPDAAGTLRVRATLVNTAAQSMPYPLLRVTLADRFGTRIGRREFEPSEYLGQAPAGMLAAGERAEAAVDLQDPGKEAEAFEIDVCLRGADRMVTCAGEAAEAAAAAQGK